MRPKPHPNYGCTVAEEENELPEATADALIGRKRRVDEMVMGEMDKQLSQPRELKEQGRVERRANVPRLGKGRQRCQVRGHISVTRTMIRSHERVRNLDGTMGL